MSNRSATIVLIAALLLVFLYEVASGVAGSEGALVPLGALRTRGWSATDSWRILTFSFLHLNALHLTLNIVALYWLGGIVERQVCAAGMLAVFASGGLMSGLVGMVLGQYLPTTGIAVGASGAVFGLLGAALVLEFRPDGARRERDQGLRVILPICLIVAVVISLLPGVSLAGHIGGLIGGVLVAPFVVRRRTSR